ncbi:hypothetical protein ABEB22_10445 [Thioclava sp. 'Guangxiensis']|uniref:hypothetical protein n=1 Tax=Thioclava sp. 'Guangxiensis' TaxID=3149044 RepID=UPI003877FA2B
MRLASTLIGTTATTLLAALPFSLLGAPQDSADRAAILLYSDPALPTVFREALGSALSQLAKGEKVLSVPMQDAPLDGGQILVRYSSTTFNSTVISGFLSWEDATGHGATGPTIGLSAMDREIGDDLLRDFAADLTQNFDLPL